MKRWLGNISLWSTTTWELTGVASLGLGSRLRTDETEMSPPCKTQPSPVSICFKVLFQDAKLNLSFIHPSFHEQYYVHRIDAHQNFLKAISAYLRPFRFLEATGGTESHICHTATQAPVTDQYDAHDLLERLAKDEGDVGERTDAGPVISHWIFGETETLQICRKPRNPPRWWMHVGIKCTLAVETCKNPLKDMCLCVFSMLLFLVLAYITSCFGLPFETKMYTANVAGRAKAAHADRAGEGSF